MIGLFLFQATSSFIIYLLFFLAPWFRERRKKESNKAYFTGLMFATLFYYGAPIWLWLYGVKTTFFLIVYSIGAAFILAVTLGAVFGVSEPIAIGVLLQIPVRVIAGNWLARNHVRLRSRSVA